MGAIPSGRQVHVRLGVAVVRTRGRRTRLLDFLLGQLLGLLVVSQMAVEVDDGAMNLAALRADTFGP